MIVSRRIAAAAAALALALGSAAWAQEATAPPAGHPFSKIEPGMVQEKVASILGQPTSRFDYPTGKNWIPVVGWLGRDTHHWEWYYKGKGVVIFNKRWTWSPISVLRVDYDPSEDGYHN